MTAGPHPTSAVRTRKRPANRRDVILAAAARIFAESGFHATHLSAIADAAGISTPALYRHFSGKYELFAAALIELAADLTAAADEAPQQTDPALELATVVRALTSVALDNREAGNIYRREPGLLHGEDRIRLAALSRRTRARLSTPLRTLRPELSDHAVGTLVTATLSVAASPVTHRVALARKAAVDVLSEAADSVLRVTLPEPGPSETAPGLAPLGKREGILTESIRLFAEHSFHEVTLEQIGAAAGLPPSGVYRHFPSKHAILSAAMWRASERTTAAITDGLSRATTPAEALVALAARYSALCVEDPEIMTVYLRETTVLEAAELRSLRLQQRRNVDEWATWLQRARPEVASAAARFLVHAALNVATDLAIGYRGIDAKTVGAIVAAVLLPEPA